LLLLIDVVDAMKHLDVGGQVVANRIFEAIFVKLCVFVGLEILEAL